MMLCSETKQVLRELLKAKRASLSRERREEAAEALISSVLPRLSSYRAVLSFHSFSDEIHTHILNVQLSAQNKLLLPKIDGDSLMIFQVFDVCKELKQNAWGLYEPNPALCTAFQWDKIDCVLVPGLGFDLSKQRIGYGKGHYDKLLLKIPQAKRIGIGFKEQLASQTLPCEPHDIVLDEVLLI